MKNLIRLMIILAVFCSLGNLAFAQEAAFSDNENRAPDLSNIEFLNTNSQPPTSPPVNQTPAVNSTPNADEILLNTSVFNFEQEDVYKGTRTVAFDNNFVFQIDKKKVKAPVALTLTESILSPASTMAPPKGFQMASKIYEYDFSGADISNLKKAVWISIKYDSADYFRKNLYYWDDTKNQWVGIKGIISNTVSKIIATINMPKAKVAILEDIDIMTEGSASWYKYKGCNCAASPDYPKGTKLKVTNVQNGKSVVVKVNDWGPDRSVFPNRVIDLDVVAFRKIARKADGLCQVKVEPLSVAETTTKK